MEQTLISNENVKIPKLLYGTAWKKEQTATLVELAIKSGFRGIDTAAQPKHYNEKLVGVALNNLFAQGYTRESLFIETKFTPKEGQDRQNIPYNPNDALEKQVLDSFEMSKKNLQTSYVDSYILHSPLFPFSNLQKVWRAMESIYIQGEAKQLGISNCYDLSTLEKLYDFATIKPSVLQNRFYADSNYDVQIRDWCQQKGIIYLAFWTLTANPHILAHEIMLLLAKKYQKTPAQIFYRYLTQNNIVPLIGTTSPKHMKEDVSVFEFELENRELQHIEQLLN
ncbi:MAG: aldo/keto reductase family protein [Candidatus Marinarcus sp.]|uniref:aldo/keto reductase family protein n=1 Tax=Candidatus Marinarcus sp. TaxID=3100987 RepID=UPI003B0077FA